MKKIKHIAILALLAGSVAQAQITYVDAIVESTIGTPNTVATSGASTNIWYEPNGAFSFSEKWARRTDPTFGNGPGQDILQARNTINAFEELTTTITGLTSGKVYRVYAFFWDVNLIPDTQEWSLDAGLVSSNLTSYSGESDTDPFNADGYASNLTFATPGMLVDSGGRYLIYADIGWTEVDASGEIKVYIDNTLEANNGKRSWYDGVGYEEIARPRNRIVWEDDFAGIYNGKHIEWHPNWTANSQDGAWEGTNAGYMIQRPTVSTNTGKGFGGGVRLTTLEPEVEESMVVNFDWRMFTDGLANNSFMDVVMATNVVMQDQYHSFPLHLNSTNTAMGFRITFNSFPGPGDGQLTSNGTVQIAFADNTEATITNLYDPAILGLAPNDGDNDSDTIAVSYVLEKTATTNVWVASLTLSNTTTSAAIAMFVDLTNSVWYNNQEFYFAQFASSDLTNGASIGNEFDNFQGIIRGPAGPNGWDAFVIEYDLSGLPTADFDGDGDQDAYEYATGGNPTNIALQGIQPVLVSQPGNIMEYRIPVLTNGNRGITYLVDNTDDLIIASWASDGWSSISTNAGAKAGFIEEVYSVDTSGLDAQFFRLQISQP